jgi:hypothetical protein
MYATCDKAHISRDADEDLIPKDQIEKKQVLPDATSSTFPCQTHEELVVMQQTDPTMQRFLHYWNKQEHHDALLGQEDQFILQ